MQNRFITFDERMMPGPGHQSEGLFFDQHAHHNIPGYLDNVMVYNLPGPYWDCASNFRLERIAARSCLQCPRLGNQVLIQTLVVQSILYKTAGSHDSCISIFADCREPSLNSMK